MSPGSLAGLASVPRPPLPRPAPHTTLGARLWGRASEFWAARALGGHLSSRQARGVFGVWVAGVPGRGEVHTFSRGPMARKKKSRQRYGRVPRAYNAGLRAPVLPALAHATAPRPTRLPPHAARSLANLFCGSMLPAYATVAVGGRGGPSVLVG